MFQYDLKTVGALLSYRGVPRSRDGLGAAPVVGPGGGAGVRYLGSCFAFGRPGCYLTAAHVIAGVDPATLAIGFVPKLIGFVASVSLHPSVDLAAVRVEQPEGFPWGPVPEVASRYGSGDDYFAFGYPEIEYGNLPSLPTTRLVKGHLQRFFDHRSVTGYKYAAGEMSTVCSPGMSGAPVIRREPSFELLGVVTDFVEAGTLSSRSEEVETSGQEKVTVVYRDIVRYGVALMLSPHREWLNSVLEVAA